MFYPTGVTCGPTAAALRQNRGWSQFQNITTRGHSHAVNQQPSLQQCIVVCKRMLNSKRTGKDTYGQRRKYHQAYVENLHTSW